MLATDAITYPSPLKSLVEIDGLPGAVRELGSTSQKSDRHSITMELVTGSCGDSGFHRDPCEKMSRSILNLGLSVRGREIVAHAQNKRISGLSEFWEAIR